MVFVCVCVSRLRRVYACELAIDKLGCFVMLIFRLAIVTFRDFVKNSGESLFLSA